MSLKRQTFLFCSFIYIKIPDSCQLIHKKLWGVINLEKFIIKGGRKLCGEVNISGAKNAAVAIIPAVILADEPCILENVPNISDVSISLRILYEMGADVKYLDRNTVRIDATGIKEPIVP